MITSKPTILFIDDEPINVMLFSLNFKKYYTVITAESGIQGLEMLKQHPEIQVVLSDMKMPGMTGIDFILEAKKEFPDVLYYIVSGYDLINEIAEAMHTNLIEDYFCKPFNIPKISKTLAEVVEL